MPRIADRFRGYLPVVVDVETGGFNSRTDALLEIAACIIRMDDFGRLIPADMISVDVEPFDGARVDPKALEFTGLSRTRAVLLTNRRALPSPITSTLARCRSSSSIQ